MEETERLATEHKRIRDWLQQSEIRGNDFSFYMTTQTSTEMIHFSSQRLLRPLSVVSYSSPATRLEHFRLEIYTFLFSVYTNVYFQFAHEVELQCY